MKRMNSIILTVCLVCFNFLQAKTVDKLFFSDDDQVEILNQTLSTSQVNKTESIEYQETKLRWLETKNLIELLSYLMVQGKTNRSNVVLIDTRNSNEYNGWKSLQSNQTDLLSFYDEKNGHIAFAHNFDADWIDSIEPTQLQDFLTDRFGFKLKNGTNLNRDRLILYDTNILRLEKVKNYFTSQFLIHTTYLCRVEEDEIGSFFEKTNETANLFFQEPFYDMLISPEILNAIVRPFVNESNILNVNPLVEYKLIDVGTDFEQYNRSHIPGAVYLDVKELEEAHLNSRKNSTETAKVLLDLGISPNNTHMVLLYGNPDPMAAFRVALIMKWMGVKDIRVLNGGYNSWSLKKFTTETNSNKRETINSDQDFLIKLFDEQSINTQSSLNYIVDQDYVLDLVKNQELFSEQYELIDVRSYAEYMGEQSGYSDLEIKGRIPSSIWGGGGSSSNNLQDFRNPDLTMRSGYEILRMWDDLGIDYKNKHLIFYCGNGWRSSEVMFYAELMGLYRISFYDGGWLDWTSNKNNSIQIGSKIETLIPVENVTNSADTNSTLNSTNLFENTTLAYNLTEIIETNSTLINTANQTITVISETSVLTTTTQQSNASYTSNTSFTLTSTTRSSFIASSSSSIRNESFFKPFFNFIFIYVIFV